MPTCAVCVRVLGNKVEAGSLCNTGTCFQKYARFTTHWVSYWSVFIVCSGSFYCCSVFHNPLIRLPSATWDVTQCEELCTVLFYYFLPLCSLLACVVAWELPCRAVATQSPTASVFLLKESLPSVACSMPCKLLRQEFEAPPPIMEGGHEGKSDPSYFILANHWNCIYCVLICSSESYFYKLDCFSQCSGGNVPMWISSLHAELFIGFTTHLSLGDICKVAMSISLISFLPNTVLACGIVSDLP